MLKSNKGVLFKGGAWTSLSFIVVSLVYVLRISVLTRYIDKSDFGLVAIVLFVLGFTNIFADLGVSTALLSKKDVSKKEYSSLYWGGLFLSIVLYVIIFCASPYLAAFYGYALLKSLIPIMGIDIVISTLGRQFSVFMQKDLKFKELAFIKIASELISLLIDILLAINGFGIWTLVFSLLSSSLITLLLNFIISYKSHPLLFYFNFQESKPLYVVGFYQTGSQVLDYLSSQIDILILGKVLPMAEMGVYSIIKTLVFRVYISLNQIVTKVMIPVFASIQYDLVNFKSKFLKFVNFITIINTFFYLTIAVLSKSILFLFYGPNYVTDYKILQILCMWGVCSSIVSCSGGILIVSTGKTLIGFKWTQLRFIINPLFVFIGAYYGGVIGVCIAQSIFAFLSLFLYQIVVISKILNNLKMSDYLKEIVYTIFRGLLLFTLFVFLNDYFIVSSHLVKIAVNVLVLLAIFSLMYFRKIVNHLKQL
ncbi:MOP flippase family protein [Flavobacterium sp.]|uniref:MOP flippase family protein n=1 Tax=Flavobacterium sp. TaxID=239 RepID=UPI0026060311|nr:MOP flippase family protein [Flavobacterium sp.]MDG2433859.1 MOP flippase family protein [Flavobacterium sp.]